MTIVQLYVENVILPETCSNEVGDTPSCTSLSWYPGGVIIATPSWLQRRVTSLVLGLARSITENPLERKLLIGSESAKGCRFPGQLSGRGDRRFCCWAIWYWTDRKLNFSRQIWHGVQEWQPYSSDRLGDLCNGRRCEHHFATSETCVG